MPRKRDRCHPATTVPPQPGDEPNNRDFAGAMLRPRPHTSHPATRVGYSSSMNEEAAQAWFIAGTIPLILAGGLHILGALIDTVRLTFFAPVDDSARQAVEGTGIRLVRMFGGSGNRPS